jgi:KTSC domain
MEKVPVQSKGIDWVAYDEAAQTLDVHFGSSGTYRYFDVPATVYDWLLRAPSKGKFVNRLVKDRYRYERLESGPHAGTDADLRELLEKSLDEPTE